MYNIRTHSLRTGFDILTKTNRQLSSEKRNHLCVCKANQFNLSINKTHISSPHILFLFSVSLYISFSLQTFNQLSVVVLGQSLYTLCYMRYIYKHLHTSTLFRYDFDIFLFFANFCFNEHSNTTVWSTNKEINNHNLHTQTHRVYDSNRMKL